MRQEHGLGRLQGGAGPHGCLAQALLDRSLGGRELHPVVDPHRLALLGRQRHGPPPGRAGRRHGIGQVILALRVVAADAIENLERGRAVERHQARVAELHGALGLARVLVLADRREFAVLDDQAAVARRVRGLEAERRERCNLREGSAQGPKRLGRDQRHVGEQHEQMVAAARDGGPGRQHRVGSAEPLALHHDLDFGCGAARFRRHVLAPRTDHDHDPVGPRGSGGVEHMRQHRAPGEPVQHLRGRGSHSRPLARRQHHGEAFRSVHPSLLEAAAPRVRIRNAVQLYQEMTGVATGGCLSGGRGPCNKRLAIDPIWAIRRPTASAKDNPAPMPRAPATSS